MPRLEHELGERVLGRDEHADHRPARRCVALHAWTLGGALRVPDSERGIPGWTIAACGAQPA